LRNNVFIKFAFRQPLRTLVLALLVGAAAFVFVSRSVEYSVVTNKISTIENHYRSIGFLLHPEYSPPQTFWGEFQTDHKVNAHTAAELIARNQHIRFEDRLLYAQGVLAEDVSNASIIAPHFHFDYPQQQVSYVYFYAIFDRISPGGNAPGYSFIHIHVVVDDVVAGYYEHIAPSHELSLRWIITDSDNPFDDLESGERYLFRAERHFPAFDPVPDRERAGIFYLHQFNAGEMWYLHAPKYSNIDLSDPMLASLADEIEIQIENQRTMRIVATVDLSAMPLFQSAADTYVLYDGRFIDFNDYENANHVTVVSRGFARYHNLTIGDTITLNLRDMQTPGIPFGHPNWREYSMHEVELTIVGLHCWSTRWRGRTTHTFLYPTMYVPRSVLPGGFSGDDSFVVPSDYSFVLDSVRNENAFLEEVSQPLRDIGFEVRFFEHGADTLIASADPIIQSVTVNLAAFSLVSLLVLCLVGFVFLHQNKRNFAIMRALGVTPKKALKQKVATAALLWLPFIIFGSVMAWNFALTQAGNTLTAFAEADGYIGLQPPPIWLLIALCISFVTATLALIFIGGMKTARLSVLELLQGRKQTKTKKSTHFLSAKGTTPLPSQYGIISTQQASTAARLAKDSEKCHFSHDEKSISINTKKQRRMQHFTRFTIHHIVRAPVKSILATIVAMFFILSLSWLQVTIDRTQSEVDILFDSILITGQLQRFNPFDSVPKHPMDSVVSRHAMNRILEDELVRNAYILAAYEFTNIIPACVNGEFPREALNLIWEDWEYADPLVTWENTDWIFAVSSLETLISRIIDSNPALWGGESFDIQFAEGYDESDFYYNDRFLSAPIPVVVHEELREKRGLELGGIAYIAQHEYATRWWTMRSVAQQVRIIGMYSGSTVGGAMHAWFMNYVIMPLEALEFMRGLDMTYITAFIEFEPSRDGEVHEFRELTSSLLGSNFTRVGRPPPYHYHWETPLMIEIFDEEFNNTVIPMEQNLDLLRILYPIAVAGSVMLSVGFALLLIFQSVKNAAIMRVLGSRKMYVRSLLCAELFIVTLIGVFFGLVFSLLIGFGFATERIFIVGLYLAGTVIGGVIGAMLVSKKSPLELLQVKE
jgi:ABC-type antimicrobial peptide transport system permease subunit